MADVSPARQLPERRLAAILAADIAGYSRLMDEDEAATVRDLKADQGVVLPMIASHGGRIIDTAGDGILAQFPSAVRATECAVAIQRTMAERNRERPDDRRLMYRVGVNLGDVFEDEERIYGDGVNIAARLEALAEPGGILISGKVFGEVDGKVDVGIEDRGEHQVKNISRPIHAYAVQLGDASASTLPPRPALAMPDKPSIAVLPFQNMSGDPEQEYFADGIVEDIIMALGRVQWFFVIARNSSFTYKGVATDVRQVGRELGVHYVLEGSVRKAGERIRISGRLIDATNGRQVWSDRFEGDLADIFDLQDRVTQSVVGAVEPSLRGAEINRAKEKPTQNMDAYSLYFRALSQLYGMSRESLAEALNYCRSSVTKDPSFSLAKGLLAFCHVQRNSQGWLSLADREEGIAFARAALEANRDDPATLRLAGIAIGDLAREYDLALSAMGRSLALNPNSAQAHNSAGWLDLLVSEPESAIRHFEQAIRLSPLDPEMGIVFSGIATAHFIAGRFGTALDWAERTLRERPGNLVGHRMVVASLVQLGRADEAVAARRRMQETWPDLRLAHLRATSLSSYKDPAIGKLVGDSLTAAGLPE
ncbi:MAG: adenylate cyclase [Methylobacteriaceae bacterium]|nr:adenylate cyclase [Methylobacteriaceae bacterium]